MINPDSYRMVTSGNSVVYGPVYQPMCTKLPFVYLQKNIVR